jgi:3-deoxy-7-phosphoheptulonate synthase
MIIHLKNSTSPALAEQIAMQCQAMFYKKEDFYVLVTPSALKELPAGIESNVEAFFPMKNDMQLASREYHKETREVKIGNITIGGSTKNTVMIGGPCSVESEEQIESSSLLLKELGLTTLRGGCYKPRTSPYSFQGLGLEGLKLLAKMREKHGLNVITEVRDASQIDEVIKYSDVIQVGAKAMYDQGILRACAKTQKPVLIKRGFGSTLQEFVQAAEFVLSGGNEKVILCERGIRTFETGTRFTLDLCGVAWVKQYSNLPIILDPSHAMGYAYGIADLSRACVAMGIDGLLVEAHPNPKVAKSDAAQQLNHDEFRQLLESLKPVAQSVGYSII